MAAAAAVKSKAGSKAAAPLHPTYQIMVKTAIAASKERSGSSRQAVVKYVVANYKVKEDAAAARVRQCLQRLSKKGEIQHTKGTGASGSFKIAKVVNSKKPANKSTKAAASKKTATPAKKLSAEKKKPASGAKKITTTKKPAPKTASAKSTKKTATKPKKPAAKKASKPKPPATKKPAVKRATKGKK